MGLYDRDYTQDSYQYRYQHAPQMRFGFPRLTPVVKWILLINCGVFLLISIIRPIRIFAIEWLSVYPKNFTYTLQLWRLITYQFLHDPRGFGHIFWNMLLFYFFGTMLERFLGSRKFLFFYLICGSAGGFFYPFLTRIGWLTIGPLIGASGAVLGVIIACAILFPSLKILVFFTFPIPISVLAIIITLISIIILLNPDRYANAGGEAAHLAGIVVGAAYILSKPLTTKWLMKSRAKKWRKQIELQQNLQSEVDRILEKVHTSGIQSLSAKEKRILKKATQLEQERNKI